MGAAGKGKRERPAEDHVKKAQTLPRRRSSSNGMKRRRPVAVVGVDWSP